MDFVHFKMLEPSFYNSNYYRIMSTYISEVLTVCEMSTEDSRNEFESMVTDYDNNYYSQNINNFHQLNDHQKRNYIRATHSLLKKLKNIESDVDYWRREISKINDLVMKTLSEFNALKKPESVDEVNSLKYKTANVDFENYKRSLSSRQKDIILRNLIVNLLVMEIKDFRLKTRLECYFNIPAHVAAEGAGNL